MAGSNLLAHDTHGRVIEHRTEPAILDDIKIGFSAAANRRFSGRAATRP
jgi:hypothetical protein